MSNVAGGQDPRHARFERKRTALERPIGIAKVWSCEDETPGIPFDLRRQPLSVRVSPDQKEQCFSVDGLLASIRPIAKHQPLEPPVARTPDDLGPESYLQLWLRLHFAN